MVTGDQHAIAVETSRRLGMGTDILEVRAGGGRRRGLWAPGASRRAGSSRSARAECGAELRCAVRSCAAQGAELMSRKMDEALMEAVRRRRWAGASWRSH